ncbi:MAG: DUF3185 family protein [Rariglobus sp.]
MSRIIGIILIVVGGFLIYKGVVRKDSLAGEAAETGTKIANKIDGGARVPEHYYYLIGGGILAAVGIGATVRGGKN